MPTHLPLSLAAALLAQENTRAIAELPPYIPFDLPGGENAADEILFEALAALPSDVLRVILSRYQDLPEMINPILECRAGR
jgi:hypothetical protein